MAIGVQKFVISQNCNRSSHTIQLLDLILVPPTEKERDRHTDTHSLNNSKRDYGFEALYSLYSLPHGEEKLLITAIASSGQ